MSWPRGLCPVARIADLRWVPHLAFLTAISWKVLQLLTYCFQVPVHWEGDVKERKKASQEKKMSRFWYSLVLRRWCKYTVFKQSKSGSHIIHEYCVELLRTIRKLKPFTNFTIKGKKQRPLLENHKEGKAMRHIKLHVYTDLTSSAAESCFSSSSMLANSSNRFSSAWSIAFSRCSFITVATRRILFSTSTYLQRKRSKIQYDAEVKYNVEIFCITFIIWEFEKNLPGSLPCSNDFKALNISHTRRLLPFMLFKSSWSATKAKFEGEHLQPSWSKFKTHLSILNITSAIRSTAT